MHINIMHLNVNKEITESWWYTLTKTVPVNTRQRFNDCKSTEWNVVFTVSTFHT